MREIAKKSRNWEEFAAKKQIEQDKQELMSCLCIKRGIQRPWVHCRLRFGNYRTKYIPRQMRERILRSWIREQLWIRPLLFWVPVLCRAATLDCRTINGMLWVLQGTFLNDLLKKDFPLHSSSIQRIWASSFQEFILDTVETARRRDSEMKRESLNTSVPSPHFQSRSGRLNQTGGTYSHSGVMDYPRIPISELHIGKFPDPMEFQSWKVNFRTEVCLRTADPQITIALDQRSWDCKVNWRTYDIATDYRERISWLRYAWCDDCVSLEKE